MSLAERATRALQWRFAATFVGAGLQFGIGALLARLLTPKDFGIVALAFVVLGLLQPLGDLGLGSAVVQRAHLTARHIRTAFTASVLIGVMIAAVIVGLAPVAASVMRDARVTPVMQVLALSFCFRALSTVAEALLQRQLDFRRQFFIDTASYLIGYGAVGTTLALSGYGVWSLVGSNLMQATIACASRLLMVRHGMLPLLAQQELKDLLRFGVGATASLVVNSLARNGDNFVVGRSMGAAALGLYDRAYSLMNLPFSYGAGVISGVLFPALAQVQTEPDRMRRGYLLATQVTAMIAAPVMGGMAVAAPHLVVSVYGAQWTSTILPLQILCAAGYFRSLYHVGGIVAHSAGRVYNELWRQIVYAALVVVGATFGARYGLPGVAFGVSFAIMYMFVATGHLALRVTRTPWRSYLRAQIVGLMTGAVTCGVAMAVRWYLERLAASSPVITISIIASCGITWGLCLMWRIGEPEFAELRAKLPPNYLRLIGRVRRLPLAAPGAE